MRIIFIHRREWPANSPGATAATMFCHALSEKKATVYLITAKGPRGDIDQHLKEFFGLVPNPNLQVVLCKKIGNSSKIFYLIAYLKAIRLARKQKIDAIISRDPGFWSLLARLKAQTGVRVFAELHNYHYTMTDDPDFLKDARIRKKYIPLERKYLPKMDGLLCTSSPLAILYKRHFPPDMVHVLPSGAVLGEQIKPRNFPLVIGYLGGLQAQRDFDTVFQAMKIVALPGLKLLIVGGHPRDVKSFQSKINDLGLAGQVELTGWLPYKEIGKHLKTFSIGLVPMKDNLYNREVTSPLKILDYLARGIPVLSGDLLSAREFIEEGKEGMFYEPGNAGDLASKIAYMVGNPSLREKMGKAAYAKAKMYTWERKAERFLQILKRKLEKPQPNVLENSLG